MSLNRPIGVPGGMTPSTLTTLRAASMAAAVERRCHTSSKAETVGAPIGFFPTGFHVAHDGLEMDAEELVTGAPPPTGAADCGTCSTACQSLRSGVITTAITLRSA